MSVDTAYERCRAIAREHARSFYLASRFLDRERRRAIWAIYAMCRTADDLADGGGTAAERLGRLDVLEGALRAAHAGGCGDPLLGAYADAVARFGVPLAPALDLLRGVRIDIVPRRYATAAELDEYCYLVASTVGLLTAPVLGARSPDALPYAARLGVAMQLTNILRDVGEDLRMGRLYLPLDALARHGVAERALAAGTVDAPFVRLMREQIARAHALYDEAEPGIALLPPRARLAVRVAARTYRGILGRIEANRYDVFARRAYVPWPRKAAAVLRSAAG